MRAPLALLLFAAAAARGAVLPGFRVQLLGTTVGFASSIAIDSHNTIYYTTTAGNLFRFSDGQSKLVTHVKTVAEGDSGLLGMALRDDNTAIVHYTTPRETADIVSSIDLTSGAETVLQSFVCDKDVPQRGSSPEHHGGNPSVAEDGSIFVGIGDYGGRAIAAMPEWNGGKIFRLFPDGRAQQFARGLRNPFDMAWDAAHQRLIATDNGDVGNDEINVVHQGDYLGWPFTEGAQAAIDGAVAPVYVFPITVAPTGLVALNGRNSMFPTGYLLGGFVTKAIYYIPDIDARPLPDPIPVIRGETGYIIDIAQTSNGDVYFVSGSAIYRLIEPQRGDCNGDGRVDAADVAALAQELLDGNPEPAIAAQNGSFPGSWGCDVNGDGLIDSRDMTALLGIVSVRSRAVRGGRDGASGRH